MKPALVLVDLQNDFLARPGLEPSAPELVLQAATLLATCRQAGVPVVHVRTSIHPDGSNRLPHWKARDRWWCVIGTPGHESPPPLQPRKDEPLVHKAGFNPFRNGELDGLLVCRGIDTLILAGLHLHACVRTTAVEALERGLRVLVAEDAVGSDDPPHAAATRRWLSERGVEFRSVAAIGAALTSRYDAPYRHFSPRDTAMFLFEVPETDQAQLDAVVDRAVETHARQRRQPPSSVVATLARLSESLEPMASELAHQMAVDIGKPLAQGLEEIRRAIANVQDALQRAAVFQSQRSQAGGLIRHRPHGVVAIITPWNNPIAIPLGKIIPALAYGNSVLWKPAPAATRLAERMLLLLRRLGVPAGALELVRGGAQTAHRLAAHRGVQALTFTGSGRAGAMLADICARRCIPIQAELGGNNATIVWDGAALPAAAASVAQAALGFAGQRCTATRRVIVPKRMIEPFSAALRAAAEQMLWADPLDPQSEIGPVLTLQKAAQHEAWLAEAVADPTMNVERLQIERARGQWRQAGAYAQPAQVRCERPESLLVQQETFTPLLVIQCAEDFEHALALCNGVRQGLVASLFGGDPAMRERFLEEAQAGVLKLDAATAGVSPCLPFGGWRASGLGPPEHAEADALFFTRWQTVYGQRGQTDSA